MPRFRESRTWNLLKIVPANCFRLVKEVLSLRQKIVSERQCIHFLRRCLDHNVIPNFIANKRLHETCGLTKGSRQVQDIERRILRTALKTKQNHMFSMLLKCVSKEECRQRLVSDHLWRRIVGESKSICDSVRSNAKFKLQLKFSRLVDPEQNQRLRPTDSNTSSSLDHNKSNAVSICVPSYSRVSVIGNVSLSNNALSVLDLGPSFSPVQSIGPRVSRKIVGSLQLVHDRLRWKAKAEQQECGRQNAGDRNLPTAPFPSTHFKPQEPNHVVDSKFRMLATSFFSIITRRARKPPKSNLTPAQRLGLREIRDLCSRGEIKISVSDKGGEFVVISRELDMAITQYHLEDDTLYQTSSEKEFKKQYRHLNKVWVETANAVGLPKSTIARLKCELPSCPVLYLLIKTHKLSASDLSSNNPHNFKVRPIISCVGGPTDRISWFLNLILAQLLKYVPAHLSNTSMFLEHLRRARFERDCVIESFDVTSLYTNVSNDAAMQAVLELLIQHEGSVTTYGLSIRHVMTLLSECLNCAIFRWSGNYYRQIRGLAMGQRLAPTLAIAFMSKIENPIIQRKPLLYCRYIDDCCIVCSTQDEMDTCFNILNHQFPYIKFTREKPNASWLSFLNVQVHLTNGKWKTRWYRKPSCKNILIHHLSAHPQKTKKAVIANMFRTAARVTSDAQERIASLHLASQIAQSNGYPKEWQPKQDCCSRRRLHVAEGSGKIPFCVPFISDQISSAIRASVREAGLQDVLRVVDIHTRSRQGQTGTSEESTVSPHQHTGQAIHKYMSEKGTNSVENQQDRVAVQEG